MPRENRQTRLLRACRLALPPLLILCAAGASIAGCAATAKPRPIAAESLSPDAGAAWLAMQAQAERASALNSADTAPPQISPPPGLDAAAVTQRGGGDQRAQLNLRTALLELADRHALPALTPPPRSAGRTPSERLQAAILYVRGEAALLGGDALAAARALEGARRIDPASPAILRQLGRAYTAVRNQQLGAGAYRDLLAIEPADGEAALFIAMNDAALRRFEDAAVRLSGLLESEPGLRYDSGARLVAQMTLSGALEELGYDRASLQAASLAIQAAERFQGNTVYVNQITAIRRQRGDHLRRIGDAHMRLGEPGHALEAYDSALAAFGDGGDVLLPRMLLAELSLGRSAAAADRFLSRVADAPRDVDDRHVQLATWLGRHLNDDARQALAAALQELHVSSPANLELARTFAQLLPQERAANVLARLVAENPRDEDLQAQLYRSLAGERGSMHAFNLAETLIAQSPQRALKIADAFISAIGVPADLLARLDVDEATAEPDRSLLHARLLYRAGDLGASWRETVEGLRRDPGHRGLLLHRLELAAVMQEPALFEDALEAARSLDDQDALILQSQALRQMGRPDDAVDAARGATAVEEGSADAWVELARAAAESSERALAAVEAAERALEIDPGAEEAFEVLLALYVQRGPLADVQKQRETARRLLEAAPQGALVAMKAAEEFTAARRFVEAAERLRAAIARDPDVRSQLLAPLLTAWHLGERAESAIAWLESQRRDEPDDPNLLRHLGRAYVLEDRIEDAMALAAERLEVFATDPVAEQIQELALRASGRNEEAFELSRTRLLRRPPGVQRTIELATLSAGAGHDADAIGLLESLPADLIDDESRMIASRAIAAALLIDAELEAANQMRQRMISAFIERYPDAPLSMYGALMLAMARLDTADDALAALAERAVSHAADAGEAGAESYRRYQFLAQELVNAGHPLPAARLIEARLRDAAVMVPAARGAFAQMAQAAWVAAGDIHAAVGIIDLLKERSELNLLPAPPPDHYAQALYNLGTLCSVLGMDDEADVLFDLALEASPSLTMAANNLGYHRIDINDASQRYSELIEQAHAAEPDNSNILDSLAWLRYKQGRFAGPGGGIELIEAAIETLRAEASLNAEVLDHYGDLLWRAGRQDDALEAWREALSLAEDTVMREESTQDYLRFQERIWQLIVRDPQEVYEALHGELAARLRAKVQAAEAGEAPTIAPTFAEAAAE